MAALAISEVALHGRSLSTALGPLLMTLPVHRDRAFAQECVYGVLRWYHRLDYQLGQLMRRPLRERDGDLHMLLLAGLYQILFLDVAPHAAVAATVEACAVLRKPWAKPLLNGVLRNAVRNRAELERAVQNDESALWAHPQWLIEEIRRDWPTQWQDILRANNERAPLTLRVNPRKTSRSAYLAALAQHDMEGAPTRHATSGIRLMAPVPVDQLPRFAEGYVSVQDEAAQLAAALLDLPRGGRVLDGCAAPGGKTAHILETGPDDLAVTAVDSAHERLDALEDTLRRLGLACHSICADLAATESWWDGVQFDRVLLDVPCSATGIVRRKPDIKFLRKADDLERLATQQVKLLQAVWPVLKSGARLLYSTCTIMTCENDASVGAFLERTPGAECIAINARWGTPTRFGRQILPGDAHMDGFYYACIGKA